MSADRLPAYTPDLARELRAAAGLSQAAMAQAVGYTAAQNWAALEQGQRRPAPSAWILALIVADRHPKYTHRPDVTA
jgi:DNA-binding XRE family transcriptional regulator